MNQYNFLHSIHYLNAKISALKSKLLDEQFYSEASSLNGINSFIDLLMKTHYKRYLDKFLYKYKELELIDIATTNRFSTIIKLLRKSIPYNNTYEEFISQWDILSLKAFIIEKINERDWNEIAPYLIEGKETINTYKRMFYMDLNKGLRLHYIGKAIISIKTSELPKFLNKMLIDFAKTNNYTLYYSLLLDYIFFKQMYKFMKKTRSKILKNYTRKMLVTKSYLLQKRLESRNIHDDVREITGCNIKDKEFEEMEKINKDKNIYDIELELDRILAKKIRQNYPKSVMKIDKLYFYLMMLDIELKNIHRIGVGLRLRMGKEKIREVII